VLANKPSLVQVWLTGEFLSSCQHQHPFDRRLGACDLLEVSVPKHTGRLEQSTCSQTVTASYFEILARMILGAVMMMQDRFK